MERVLWSIWGVWLVLILVATLRVFFFASQLRRKAKWERKSEKRQRKAVVIVPVKGFHPTDTPRFFNSLIAQDYAHFRLIVTYQAGEEAVAMWLQEQLQLPDDRVGVREIPDIPSAPEGLQSITLVEAGESTERGQKVHNQLTALRELDRSDEIVAFVDCDIVCASDWLSQLLAPINAGSHDLATTYRWLVPKRPSLPSQIASVINASITTQSGSEWSTILWGGSMALNRRVYDELDVPALLHGSLNDDLRISKEARRQGHRIAFIRKLILPTVIDFNWPGLWEFARRQYTQVRIFSPILYTGTNLVLLLYVVGFLSAVGAVIIGYFPGWIPLAAATIIDQIRSIARQQVCFRLFPDEALRRRIVSSSWLEHMLTPFWMLFHWFVIVSTWMKRKITWAGISYRIVSREETEVLAREEAVKEKVPAICGSLRLAPEIFTAAASAGHHEIKEKPARPITEPILVKGNVLGSAAAGGGIDLAKPPEDDQVDELLRELLEEKNKKETQSDEDDPADIEAETAFDEVERVEEQQEEEFPVDTEEKTESLDEDAEQPELVKEAAGESPVFMIDEPRVEEEDSEESEEGEDELESKEKEISQEEEPEGSELNEIDVDEADEADEADEVDEADEADEADEVEVAVEEEKDWIEDISHLEKEGESLEEPENEQDEPEVETILVPIEESLVQPPTEVDSNFEEEDVFVQELSLSSHPWEKNDRISVTPLSQGALTKQSAKKKQPARVKKQARRKTRVSLRPQKPGKANWSAK